MYTYIYIHTYILTGMHTYIHTYIHVCIHVPTCYTPTCMIYIHVYSMHTYVFIWVCISIHTYRHACIHTDFFTYWYAYILTYIHVHVYIHTYLQSFQWRRLWSSPSLSPGWKLWPLCKGKCPGHNSRRRIIYIFIESTMASHVMPCASHTELEWHACN
jgi:hypothetical protein